jgi:hypothetical protein
LRATGTEAGRFDDISSLTLAVPSVNCWAWLWHHRQRRHGGPQRRYHPLPSQGRQAPHTVPPTILEHPRSTKRVRQASIILTPSGSPRPSQGHHRRPRKPRWPRPRRALKVTGPVGRSSFESSSATQVRRRPRTTGTWSDQSHSPRQLRPPSSSEPPDRRRAPSATSTVASDVVLARRDTVQSHTHPSICRGGVAGFGLTMGA